MPEMFHHFTAPGGAASGYGVSPIRRKRRQPLVISFVGSDLRAWDRFSTGKPEIISRGSTWNSELEKNSRYP